MAEVKITALPAYSDPVSTDVLPIVDVTADLTKKVSITDLLKNAATGSETAPAFAFDADPDTGMYRRFADELAFSTGGTGRLCIDSSGNVGIGLLSPETLLHVRGDDAEIRIQDTDDYSTTDGPALRFRGKGPNSTVYDFGEIEGVSSGDNNAGELRFLTNSAGVISQKMVIKKDGKVGIGESSPDHELHIKSGDPTIMIESNGSYGDNSRVIFRAKDSGDTIRNMGEVAGVGTGSNAGALTFSSRDGGLAEAMRINSSGNVGIGSSAPGANLYVKQSGTDFTAASQTVAVFQRSSTTGHSAKIAIVAGNAATSDIHFGDTDDEDVGILQYNHTDDAFNFNQNVGIGTSSPGRTLDVNGVIRSDGTSGALAFGGNSSTPSEGAAIHRPLNNTLAFCTNSAERMRINSSGNVGIGTSSIDASLHVKGANTHGSFVLEAGGTAGSNNQIYIQGHNHAGTSLGEIHIEETATNQGALVFKTNGGSVTERMRIDSSGNLIQYSTGTLERQHRQQSSSSYTATNIRSVIDGAAGYLAFDTGTNWTNGNATERMRIDSSGNVGIGATSLVNKLTVNGSQVLLANGELKFADASNTYVGVIKNSGAASTSQLEFLTGATPTERMRIDSSGRVGVGISAPAVPLDIHSTANGLPATTGTTQTHGSLRINSSQTTGCIDMGPNSASPWIQATDRTDLSQTYNLLLNPNGGNVGIGESSPSHLLDVKYQTGRGFQVQYGRPYSQYDDNALIDTLTLRNTGCTANGHGSKIHFIVGSSSSSNSSFITAQQESSAGNTNLTFGTNNTERMRIDRSGNVGIGTSSPGGNLTVTDASTYTLDFKANGSDGALITTLGGSASFALGTDNTERMRITSSGFVGVGTSDPTGGGTLNGTGRVFTIEGISGSGARCLALASDVGIGDLALQVVNRTDYSTQELIIYGDGDVANTNGAYDTISDARFKSNIEPARSQWSDIKSLEIVNYDFQGKEQRLLGVVAQQVETVSPGLVVDRPKFNEDGEQIDSIKSVHTSVIYMKAVKALQEAMERIEALEAKVAALEAAN